MVKKGGMQTHSAGENNKEKKNQAKGRLAVLGEKREGRRKTWSFKKEEREINNKRDSRVKQEIVEGVGGDNSRGDCQKKFFARGMGGTQPEKKRSLKCIVKPRHHDRDGERPENRNPTSREIE